MEIVIFACYYYANNFFTVLHPTMKGTMKVQRNFVIDVRFQWIVIDVMM